VQENRLTISEIAYLLGYAEPGVFTRAFKRWTGYNPTVFREKN
jgi:AraC-like DNA-binding protein